ncbi:DUF3800 domain-containing protein [Chitinimonas taiwanensis]|uniref:DUF3800 domain-containing protein n=1 Tax=Chitinimonas taiwanensis DSM 18899 TaxID=1121279 RepID=A0A1K2HSN8_9NEIS|nr:DUF3800 domain-containing protein [Chitinimonas taiwanensis]SFZ79577.1 Protein of unknown function [Chitinimonas taiwanensis DSM 18899]
MYFYVDESGHTGPNLFDETQPMLYYGVLSSKVNVDLLAEDSLRKLRQRAKVLRLHANELGNGGLVPLASELLALQRRLNFRFDLYRVAKPDHAIICFFDQVFDHGNNPAITWTGYWTPMRYVLLLKLAKLFDKDIAKQAWEARIETDSDKADALLTSVCMELRSRVGHLPDARSRQLISDTLEWAEKNPKKIYYNTKKKKDKLQITPNIIGFQSVMHGIASRLKTKKAKAAAIIVDQQSQFNKAQKSLSEYFAALSDLPAANGPGLPAIDFSGMPKIPIEFASSANSAGLELVDLHLWVFKRTMEGKELAPELYRLIEPHLYRGRTDEISLNAIAARWERWFEELPDPTPEQLERSQSLIAYDEERRLRAIQGG